MFSIYFVMDPSDLEFDPGFICRQCFVNRELQTQHVQEQMSKQIKYLQEANMHSSQLPQKCR